MPTVCGALNMCLYMHIITLLSSFSRCAFKDATPPYTHTPLVPGNDISPNTSSSLIICSRGFPFRPGPPLLPLVGMDRKKCIALSGIVHLQRLS